MSHTCSGAPVCVSALSTRELSFPPILAVAGSTLGFPRNWNDANCLRAFSDSVEGPAPRYFHMFLSGGKRGLLEKNASGF